MTDAVLAKLEAMSDAEYAELDLIPILMRRMNAE